MKRPILHGCAVFLALFGGLLWTSPAAAGDKSEQLRRTMADISLLSSQMAQRKADAAEIRRALAQRFQDLREEARQEARAKKISTAGQALEQPRILHDLTLMAEIDAYRERYRQMINFYRVAYDRLGYLYQQADDELKMVDTLSDLKIDALLVQAAKVQDSYLPHAQTIVIEPERLTVDPPEAFWPAIAGNP